MNRTAPEFDAIVVGAGIAGTALAYFLAERGTSNVLVVEREAQAAYHASGRSAATLVELDIVPAVQRLKVLGARFLRHPPAGFAEHPLLEQRGVVSLFREPLWGALRALIQHFAESGLRLELLTPREASACFAGVLREDQFEGAALAPEDGFIDVHELLSSYLRHARRRGVEFRFGCEVTGLLDEGGVCSGVRTPDGELRARRVVNAAGAWVGAIAERSGALPIRFAVLRRSVVLFTPPPEFDWRGWPLLWSDPHGLYFRPEPTGLLFCPMDEEPMPPCDAAPGDLAIAAGLERLRALAPELAPRSLGRRWGGLRTFSPDRVPVVGEDPALPGFFWLAGQGGYGIETSAALGQIAADLLTVARTDVFDANLLSPARFAG